MGTETVSESTQGVESDGELGRVMPRLISRLLLLEDFLSLCVEAANVGISAERGEVTEENWPECRLNAGERASISPNDGDPAEENDPSRARLSIEGI